MKVNVEISPECMEAYAVIHASKINEEIQNIIEYLGGGNHPVTAQKEDGYVVLQPSEIYMVKIEKDDAVIYCEHQKYYSRKRLYEIKEQVGQSFLQISKGTIINLEYIESIESGFSGSMLVKLKNGDSDYISRKYLPDLKRYLGL